MPFVVVFLGGGAGSHRPDKTPSSKLVGSSPEPDGLPLLTKLNGVDCPINDSSVRHEDFLTRIQPFIKSPAHHVPLPHGISSHLEPSQGVLDEDVRPCVVELQAIVYVSQAAHQVSQARQPSRSVRQLRL